MKQAINISKNVIDIPKNVIDNPKNVIKPSDMGFPVLIRTFKYKTH